MTAPAAAPQKGAIYDLGYARYAGERRPPSTLWRAIMRQQLAHSWKTVWRFKLPLFAAIVTTIVCGVVMYFKQSDVMREFQRAGAPVSWLDGIVVYGYEVYRISAFMVTMTIAAPLVARDEQTGAFTFYFARPVRARDYVIGKLAAVAILMGAIFIAGPFLLAVYRMALARDLGELSELWPWVPRSLVIGGLATAAYTALPLAISSLANRRTLALGLWAAYYIVGVSMVAAIGVAAWAPLMAIDPAQAVKTLVVELFDLQVARGDHMPPLWAAIASLVAQSAVAVVILFQRVRAQSLGSVGGAS